jgi:hypothetical protein
MVLVLGSFSASPFPPKNLEISEVNWSLNTFFMVLRFKIGYLNNGSGCLLKEFWWNKIIMELKPKTYLLFQANQKKELISIQPNALLLPNDFRVKIIKGTIKDVCYVFTEPKYILHRISAHLQMPARRC